jgi:hypothetical protein
MTRKKIVVKTLLALLGLFLLSLSASIAQAQPAPVEKTGQTTSYATGDDGDYEKGVAWPNPRFTDNGDGTVTDNLTGLMWTRDANLFGLKTWADAITACESLELGQNGCNIYTDWRLPNVKELQSLIDFSNYSSPLPAGHPFDNVQSFAYWTSTTVAIHTPYAWYVHLTNGTSSYGDKSHDHYVWPVRGGQ